MSGAARADSTNSDFHSDGKKIAAFPQCKRSLLAHHVIRRAAAIWRWLIESVGNCINTMSLAKVCGFPLVMIVAMRGQWGETNP